MSLKVLKVFVPERFPFGEADKKDLRLAGGDFDFHALCDIDGVKGLLWFYGSEGLLYNGASNKLGWPIKNYYGEAKKDACGLGHDILYAHGGEVKGLGRKLKAGECDDYIRGSMREADFSRRDAGIVDRAVRIPLVHWFHFGKKNDKEGMHLNSEIVWIPIEN